MPAQKPTIVATSIGFDSRGRNQFDWEPGPIFDVCADRSGASGTPKICFIPTASGDSMPYINGVYSAFGSRFRPSHLTVFGMPNIEDVRGHLLAQDVVWVGG